MANNEQYASNLLTDKMYKDVNVLDFKSCWLWNGSLNADGYGVTSRMIDKKSYGSLIHRISWYLLYGNIPNNMVREIATARKSIFPAPKNANIIQTIAIAAPNNSPSNLLRLYT